MPSTYTIIGLMSGTSLDGVDAAILKTDGESYIEPIDFMSSEYPEALREKLRQCFGHKDPEQEFIQDAAREMTLFHADIVNQLKAKHSMAVDAVAFHGQTIYHAPEDGVTVQIGDGALLAKETALNVVYDFRSADVANGGEGAPLLPLYHLAIARHKKLATPVTFLNIGGVSNITQINQLSESNIYACDTGPGNALIDDYLLKTLNIKYDTGGIIAKSGQFDQDLINQWLDHPYFQKPAPKSLDRDAWDVRAVEKLDNEDAVATLSSFTVQSIAHHIHETDAIYVCGGGRHNDYLMKNLSVALDCDVEPIEKLGYNGDAIEAEGFAYLAARILNGKPVSLPTTTGVKKDIKSGKIAKADAPERKTA